MNRPNKSPVGKVWCWRRWITPGHQGLWQARLEAVGCVTATFTERTERVRVLLAVYDAERAGLVALKDKFGGQVRGVEPEAWIRTLPTPPTRIGSRLEIIHEASPLADEPAMPRLHIPHGLAFGSGEHSTTYMLLRALAEKGPWNGAGVLDIGTGSGVLALAARLFGAKKVVATDFDADAVRTARQNEAFNFLTQTITWQCADVKRLRARERYDLVIANLFSGILVEASLPIAASVKVGGQLWLSGILLSQQEAVETAYHAQCLSLERVVRRGKWVMLQWGKDPR